MDFSRIREARKAAKITQDQLAKELGINRATLSKYEKGIIEPSISQVKKIANILGVNFIELMPQEMQGTAIAADIIERAGLKIVDAMPDIPISDMESEIARANKELQNHRKSVHLAKFQISISLGMLNEEGLQKAVERVQELTEIPKYQAQKPPETDE